MELNGVLAPLPTPFTDDGSAISEIRLLRLLRRLQELGVAGYVACGEVGEFGALSRPERKQLVEILLRDPASSLQVVVNVSALSTVASLDLAQHAARHGARACVLMPPFYGSFSQEEHYNYMRVVAQYAGLPVIVVDPNGVLEGELNAQLAALPGIFVAAPNFWAARALGGKARSKVDEFSMDPGASTVGALFRPALRLFQLPEEDIQRVTRFIQLHGSARVAKAAFEIQGIELGPLRGPQLALRQSAAQELQALLGIGD